MKETNVANRQRPKDGDLHHRIVETLMDKVRTDPFPSVTQLDMLEDMIRDDEVDEYTDALLDKVRNDAFPSLDHLRRLKQRS
jgi:hypothetical protein